MDAKKRYEHHYDALLSAGERMEPLTKQMQAMLAVYQDTLDQQQLILNRLNDISERLNKIEGREHKRLMTTPGAING